MIRTQIQLTATQTERIKRLAAARHVSMAQIIRASIDEFLQDNGENDRTLRKEKALAVAGRFSSGAGDLSRNHDKHLAEVFQ